MSVDILQWILVIGLSLLLFFLAPLAKTEKAFFKGEGAKGKPNFWLLTSSLVISWLFAKSRIYVHPSFFGNQIWKRSACYFFYFDFLSNVQ